MQEVIIGKVSIDEWQEFKKLRLEALKNEPDSFGGSYEDDVKKDDEYWIEKLESANKENENFILFAKKDNKLIGNIGAYLDKKEKLKHIANIFGVYVTKEFRGLGIGKLLFKEILKKLENKAEIEKFKLSVVTENKSAINLYKKFGFNIVGELKKELKIGNKYFDEYIMEKII